MIDMNQGLYLEDTWMAVVSYNIYIINFPFKHDSSKCSVGCFFIYMLSIVHAIALLLHKVT